MTGETQREARLVLLRGPQESRRIFPLRELTVFEIGSTAGNHIRIKDEQVAPNHARIFFNKGIYTLYALSERRPTKVNGEAVKKAVLKEGDVITLGNTDLRFEISSKAQERKAEDQNEVEHKEDLEKKAPSQEESPEAEEFFQARLVVLAGENAGSVYSLDEKHRYTIGRGSRCDIRLPDLKVSRQHCLLEKRGESFIVTDLNSANGTVVNGEKVKRTVLNQNDFLRLGFTVLRLELVRKHAHSKP